MSTPDVALREAWRRVSGGGHDLLLEHLLARLGEPHRRYHTATHVMWVLRHVDDLLLAEHGAAVDGDDDRVDGDAIRLAALYHDAVYDPRRHDNEDVSAALGSAVATELGWPANRCHSVRRLVLATAGHAPAAADEAVLVDADLAILGSEPKDYAAYERGVRAEYAHVGEEQWRTGRSDVLRRFLDTPRLFTTATMHRARDARARANMAAELASLR